ncbi:hypothetical protein GCM10010349_43300 [Streptomyces flavofungini]|nr:hypothetical protein GCM10010349_43300 [Streptomyces flavofungini]
METGSGDRRKAQPPGGTAEGAYGRGPPGTHRGQRLRQDIHAFPQPPAPAPWPSLPRCTDPRVALTLVHRLDVPASHLTFPSHPFRARIS